MGPLEDQICYLEAQSGSKRPTWGLDGPTRLKNTDLGLKSANSGLKMAITGAERGPFDVSDWPQGGSKGLTQGLDRPIWASSPQFDPFFPKMASSSPKLVHLSPKLTYLRP